MPDVYKTNWCVPVTQQECHTKHHKIHLDAPGSLFSIIIIKKLINLLLKALIVVGSRPTLALALSNFPGIVR